MQISAYIKPILASYAPEEWNDYLNKILYTQPVFYKLIPIPTNLTLPITLPASTPYRIDLTGPVSRHPDSNGEVRVRGLPVFFRCTALAGLSVSRLSVRLPWMQEIRKTSGKASTW